MNEVILAYKEVNLKNEQENYLQDSGILTVTIDEKPGVQAIQNNTPDLPPVAGKCTKIGRDYKYIQPGMLRILVSLDLHSGKVIAVVENQNRSIEFIKLLKKIDEYYPLINKIRIILNNHSSL